MNDNVHDEAVAQAISACGTSTASQLLNKFTDNDINAETYAFKVRVKKYRALIEKKYRKQKKKPDYGITDITDVVGMRIVTLFRSELLPVVTRVVEAIYNDEINVLGNNSIEEVILYSTNPTFDVIAQKIIDFLLERGVEEKKISKEGSNTGYSSIHIVARTNVAPDTDLLQGYFIPTEIQIRTVFEDAWGEIDHRFGYIPQRSSEGTLHQTIDKSLTQHLRTLKSFSDACAEYADCIYEDAKNSKRTRFGESIKQFDEDDITYSRFKDLNVPDDLIEKFMEIAKIDDSILETDQISASVSMDLGLEIADRYRDLVRSVHRKDFPSVESYSIFYYYAKMNEGVHRLRSASDIDVREAYSLYSAITKNYPEYALPFFRLGQVLRKIEKHLKALHVLETSFELFQKYSTLPIEERADKLPALEAEYLGLLIPKLLGYQHWILQRSSGLDVETRLQRLRNAYESTVYAEKHKPAIDADDALKRIYADCVNNMLSYCIDYLALVDEKDEFALEIEAKVTDYLQFMKDWIDIDQSDDVRSLETIATTLSFLGESSDSKRVAGRILDVIFPEGKMPSRAGLDTEITEIVAKAQYLLRR